MTATPSLPRRQPSNPLLGYFFATSWLLLGYFFATSWLLLRHFFTEGVR
ncbi:MAG: hypothetical protein ACI89G_002310 [Minisyncoccia bacterium]|jgi:hypothetical protein